MVHSFCLFVGSNLLTNASFSSIFSFLKKSITITQAGFGLTTHKPQSPRAETTPSSTPALGGISKCIIFTFFSASLLPETFLIEGQQEEEERGKKAKKKVRLHSG
jgi:hypothetical protein